MRNSIIKNSFYNVLYQFLNLLFPFITSVYVARILGKEIVGDISYTQNYVVYFVAFVSSGLPTYGIREIAKIRDQREDSSKLFSELFFLNAIFTTIALAAYFVFIHAGRGLYSDLKLAYIFALLILLNYINVDWLYTGIEEFKFISIRSLIVKIILFTCLLIFVRSKSDVYKYAIILCFGTGLNSIFNILYLKKFVSLTFKNIQLTKHLPIIGILALNVFLDSLYSKSDITLLGIMKDNSDVGIYTYAYKLPDIIMTTCVSVTAVFFPRLVEYYKENRELFLDLINRGISIIFFITVPATLGYVAIAPELFGLLYGEEFISAVPVSRLLSLMIIIKCLGNLLAYQVIFCTGGEKKRVPVYCAAAILNILLDILLIRIMGAFGAAIASVFTEMALNISLIIFEYKYVKFKFDMKNIAKSILAGALMFACVLALKIPDIHVIAKLIFCISAGVLIYVACSILLKNEIIVLLKDKIRSRSR